MLDNLVKLYDDFTKGDRVQELSQLAREEGLTLDKRQSFSKQTTEIKSFKAFSGKGKKRIMGILSKKPKDIDGKIRFYDYLRTKDFETKSTSILEMYVPELTTDYIIIEPKGVINRMKNIFVQENLPFTIDNEFIKSFKISCDEPEDLYFLKSSALDLMIEFPGITIESMGNYLIFYYRKKLIEAHKVMAIFQFAEEFVSLLCFDDADDYV